MIPNLDIFIGGRSLEKAQQCSSQLLSQQVQRTKHQYETSSLSTHGIAVNVSNTKDLRECLKNVQPNLVIHTCGPFQGQGYHIAEECIERGIHYIDLADSREFVSNFSSQLNEKAKEKNVLAVCGASTVPALSSAVVDHFARTTFSEISQIDCCLSPGNRAYIGESTMRSILSYCGKPIPMYINGQQEQVIGWQGLKRVELPTGIGSRFVSYCDVPDTDLFPQLYPSLKTLTFRAGVELNIFQISLLLMSHLTSTVGIVKDWSKYAPYLKAMSEWFYNFGSDRGGMQMILSGISNEQTREKTVVTWNLIATRGDGPQIPAVPAIILTKKLATNLLLNEIGQAKPCTGLFTLEEFMDELKDFQIEQIIQ
jgi:hypothetical protein